MEITPGTFKQRFKSAAACFPGSQDLQAFLQDMEVTHVPAGTSLIEQKGECSTLYLVWEGSLAVSIEDSDGQKILLGHIGPGEWVGEVTLIDPGPSTATVMTDSDCVLLSLPHEAFAQMRARHPGAAGALLRMISLNLAERLREHSGEVLQKISDTTYRRLPEITREKRAAAGLLARLKGVRGGDRQ